MNKYLYYAEIRDRLLCGLAGGQVRRLYKIIVVIEVGGISELNMPPGSVEGGVSEKKTPP